MGNRRSERVLRARVWATDRRRAADARVAPPWTSRWISATAWTGPIALAIWLGCAPLPGLPSGETPARGTDDAAVGAGAAAGPPIASADSPDSPGLRRAFRETWVLPEGLRARGDGVSGGGGVDGDGGGPAAPGFEETLVAAISGAEAQIWLTMYLLTSSEMVDALIAAHAAGVDVRVLLEAQPYGAETANDGAAARLRAAGIDARSLRRATGLVHAKSMIVDGRTAYVLSLNFTTAGLSENREYAIVDADPADVARAMEVFACDLLGSIPARVGIPPEHLLVSPIDARQRLGQAIDGARQTLRIEMEELSDDALTEALVAAEGRGVSVVVVVPGDGRSPATDLSLARLGAAGVEVRALDAPAKAMVVDALEVYVGSVNFSRASLDDNRELGVLFDDPGAARLIDQTIEADARAGRPW
jgi:cardiolipin synthase A/B